MARASETPIEAMRQVEQRADSHGGTVCTGCPSCDAAIEPHPYTVDVYLHGAEPYPCIICQGGRNDPRHAQRCVCGHDVEDHDSMGCCEPGCQCCGFTGAPQGLDPGIERCVLTLRAAGVETFESCQGGEGHAYPEPTVRFHGTEGDGWRALTVAMNHGLPVLAIRRTWPIHGGGPNGPYWEMTFKEMS